MWRFEKKSSVQKIEDSLMRHVVSISLSQKRCGNYINIVKPRTLKKIGLFLYVSIFPLNNKCLRHGKNLPGLPSNDWKFQLLPIVSWVSMKNTIFRSMKQIFSCLLSHFTFFTIITTFSYLANNLGYIGWKQYLKM